MSFKRRHSYRGFYPKPVDEKTLKEVFELANWAPSNCNVQPWHVHVVSGEACDRLREKMKAAATEKPDGNPTFPGRANLAATTASARSVRPWDFGSIRVYP